MDRRKVVHGVFCVYMVVLFGITVFRPGISTWKLLGGEVNLSLFEWYLPLIQAGDWGRIVYLFVGNIVWFVPFGMYLRWRNGEMGMWKITALGLGLSLVIEGLQFVMGTGYSELDDLILNTFGAWVGGNIKKIIDKVNEM